MDNLRTCIQTAKKNGVKQTEIAQMVAEIYNPMTTSVVKWATPYIATQGINQLGKFTKGGRKRNKKTRKRR